MNSPHSKLAVIFAAAIGAAAIAGQAQAADDKGGSEKCYGVTAIGKNDCQTPVSSCAGTNKVANNGQAFILLPKGTCDKLTGGSVTPKK